MRRIMALAFLLTVVTALSGPARAEDGRYLVQMPARMQEHMLTSMRDHLVVLGDILAHVAAERYGEASKIAEERLGMSSYDLHDSRHMAAFMPKPMQEAGDRLHRSSSRFAILAKDVDIARSYESMLGLSRALNEMTSACNACHAGFRIR
jgi:hypothetical protein